MRTRRGRRCDPELRRTAEIASVVLAAGAHLYLEKPIAADLAVGRGARRPGSRRAGRWQRWGSTGASTRSSSQAQRLLAAGRLSEIVEIETMFAEPHDVSSMPAWKASRRSGGGAPLDLGSHHVDLVRLLLGRELEAVGRRGSDRSTPISTTAALTFRAGACRVTVGCSFVRPRGPADAAGRDGPDARSRPRPRPPHARAAPGAAGAHSPRRGFAPSCARAPTRPTGRRSAHSSIVRAGKRARSLCSRRTASRACGRSSSRSGSQRGANGNEGARGQRLDPHRRRRRAVPGARRRGAAAAR